MNINFIRDINHKELIYNIFKNYYIIVINLNCKFSLNFITPS